MLGDAYEYLIYQFADDAGRKGGEFYTPRSVVRLIVELVKPQEGMRICDPTFGSAGTLITSDSTAATGETWCYTVRKRTWEPTPSAS